MESNVAYCVGNGQVAQTKLQRERVGTLNCMHDQQAVMQIPLHDPAPCLDASYYKGCGQRAGIEREVISDMKSVRRLTPLECERLQGFPDGWTNIPDYIDSKGKKKKASDSARYKALGNSVGLPNVYYVLHGIAEQLGFKGTLGSLFDGIGGFPICWEDICGKGTALWASEIEEFPIAVTKYRFGED